MRAISSVELTEFVDKCPDYDGRQYYPCVQTCFETMKYNPEACKLVKREYFEQIDRITGRTKTR